MAKHRKKITGPCEYCETVTRLTEDHVVPRSLWNGKPPADVPTVKACEPCNNRKSLDDTFFCHCLVTDFATQRHPMVQEILRGPYLNAVRRTLKGQRGQAPLVPIIQRQQPRRMHLRTRSGIILPDVFEFQLPDGRLDRCITWIVRGLYRAYAHRPAPAGVQYEVIRQTDPTELDETARMLLQHGSGIRKVADGSVFQCVFGILTDRPDVSLWLLEFYSSIVFSVVVVPPELATPDRE